MAYVSYLLHENQPITSLSLDYIRHAHLQNRRAREIHCIRHPSRANDNETAAVVIPGFSFSRVSQYCEKMSPLAGPQKHGAAGYRDSEYLCSTNEVTFSRWYKYICLLQPCDIRAGI
jgi:hypothetical protein